MTIYVVSYTFQEASEDCLKSFTSKKAAQAFLKEIKQDIEVERTGLYVLKIANTQDLIKFIDEQNSFSGASGVVVCLEWS